MGRGEHQLRAVAIDTTRSRRLPARQAVEELGLAVALGAGDTDDLSTLHRETDRTEGLTLQAVDEEDLARLATVR